MRQRFTKILKLSTVFFVVGFLFFTNNPIFKIENAFAGSCTSVAATNWNVGSTWGAGCTGGSGVPAAGDNVTVDTNVTIPTGVAVTITDLTVNTGDTLTVTSTGRLTATGNLVNNGTITGTGAITLSGSGTTIDGTGTIPGTGLFTLTNNKTINSTANQTVGSGTSASAISAATTITNNGTFVFAGTGAVTGGNATTTIWLQNSSTAVLKIASGTTTFLATGVLTATTAGNTVNYNGTTQTCKLTNYSNLVMGGSGAKTCALTTNTVDSIRVSNTAVWTLTAATVLTSGKTIYIDSGAKITKAAANVAVNFSPGNLDVSGTMEITSTTGSINFGNITINNGGTFSFTAAEASTITGNLTNNGTFSGTTGAITMNGTSKTIGGTGAITFASLAATSLTNTGTLTVTGVLSGTLFTNDTNSTLTMGGNPSVTTLTTTATGNTVKYNGTTQTGKVGTYYNLTIATSGVKTFATTPTVNKILSIEGTASIVVTTGVVTYGANATLQYNSASALTATTEEWITPFAATGGVIIKGGGGVTAGGAKVFNTGIPLNIQAGDLTMGSNLLTLGGDYLYTGSGRVVCTTGGVTITGNATQSIGVINCGSSAGNISMTKNGGTATMAGFIVTGGSLTINGSGGTLNMGSTKLTHMFGGTITLTSGTLEGGNSTIFESATSATAWGGTGSLFSAGTSTVVFDAAGTQTHSATATTFYNLVLSGTSAKTMTNISTVTNDVTLSGTATWTTSGALSIGGSLIVGSGTTFTTGATNTWTLTVGGSTYVYGTLTLNNLGSKTFGTLSTDSINVIDSGAMTAASGSTLTIKGGFNNISTSDVTLASNVIFSTNSQSLGVSNTNYLPMGQIYRPWRSLSVDSTNDDVYATSSGASSDATVAVIYKLVNDTGIFSNVTVPATSYWISAAVLDDGTVGTGNGKVYLGNNGPGDIYKTINGGTSWTALAQTSRLWRALSTNYTTGDVYAAEYGGDIYKQTAGSGAFSALSQTTRNWYSTAIDSTSNNVYAIVYGGDIYKQTAGSGAFNALSQTTRNWSSIAIDSATDDVYATEYYGDVYKQTAGTGDFIAMGLPMGNRNWRGIGINRIDKTLYIAEAYGDIYRKSTKVGTGGLTISGTTTISGAITVTNNLTGTVTLTGALDGDNASSTWTQGANSLLSLGSATIPFNTNGVLNASASGNTVTYTGTAAAIDNATYNNLTITGAGSTIGGTTVVNGTMTVSNTVTNNSTLTVTTALSGASTLTNSATGVLNLGGTVGITGLTATATGNIVNYTGANQAIKVVSYDDLTLSGSGTATGAVTTVTGDLTLSGSVSWAQDAITSTMTSVTMNSSGTLTLGANMVTSGALTLTQGTFDAANFTVSAASFASSNSNTRVLNMGTNTWSLTGTGTVWNTATITNLTLNQSTSTIKLTDASSTGKTFSGGGKTFNNIWLAAGAGTGSYTIVGSNTFADFKDDGTAAHSILFTAGTTTTVSTLTLTHTGTNLISLASTSLNSAWNIVDTAGTNTVDYVSITDSAASGGATWDASSVNNVNGGGNTGWTFAGASISIAGTADGNTGQTVKVAVNSVLQARSATISNGTWTITSVTTPTLNDIITVWVDNVLDANESTAVTKWSSGDISGMVLNTNVLTVGSNQNTSVSVTNMGLYDADNDEDIMHTSNSGALLVQGATNSYTGETLKVLANNTLTLTSVSTESIMSEKLDNDGVITATGTPTISLAGTSGTLFTNSGTFNQASSTVNLTGNGDATVNSGSPTFYNLTSSGTGTKTLGAGITLASGGTLNVTAGVFNPSTYTVTGSGTNTLSAGAGATINVSASTFAGSYSAGFGTINLNSSSTVDYNLAGIQTILNTPVYGNLVISGSNTKTLGGATTVAGNLSVSAGTLEISTSDISVSGTTSITGTFSDTSATGTNLLTGLVTINSGGIWTTTNNPNFEFRGGLACNSVAGFTSGSGTYTFSTNAQTISSSNGTCAITNLTNTVTVSTGLTISSDQPTVTTLTQGANAILTISGTVPSITTLSASASGNTVQYTTTASQAVKGTTYNNLTLTGATPTIGSTTVVNGTMTITGVTATNNSTLTVTTALSGTGGLTQGTSATLNLGGTVGITTLTASASPNTVTYLGTNQNVKGTTYHHLVLSTSGTKTLGGNVITNGDVTVDSGVTLDPTTGYSLTGNGTNTLAVNGIVRVQHSTFTGSYASYENKTFGSGSTADYYLNGTQTIDNTPVYYNINISNGGTKTLAGATTMAANGTLSISAGTFDPSTYLLTGSGTNTFTVASGATLRVGAATFTGSYSAGFTTKTLSSGSIVEYSRNGDQTIDSSLSYDNLTISTGGTKSLGASLTVTGTILISGGNLDTTTSGYSINTPSMTISGGTFIPRSASINLTGTGTVFTYSSGVYTAGTETLNINNSSSSDKTFAGGGQTYNKLLFSGTGTGSLTISGNNTFGTLSVIQPPHTVKFTAGSTQSVSIFDVTGFNSNLITLNSTSNGTKWNLYFTPSNYGYGTYNADYISLRDSAVTGNSYFSLAYAGANSVDDTTGGSTNTGWTFATRSVGGGSGAVESSATPDAGRGGGDSSGGGGVESNPTGTCTDGIQNGDETGIDTGGRCAGNGGGGQGGGSGDVGYNYNYKYKVASVQVIIDLYKNILNILNTIPPYTR